MEIITDALGNLGVVGVGLLCVAGVLMIALFIGPTAMAYEKRHPHWKAIYVLSSMAIFTFGFSFLAAMVWAQALEDKREEWDTEKGPFGWKKALAAHKEAMA